MLFVACACLPTGWLAGREKNNNMTTTAKHIAIYLRLLKVSCIYDKCMYVRAKAILFLFATAHELRFVVVYAFEKIRTPSENLSQKFSNQPFKILDRKGTYHRFGLFLLELSAQLT